MHIINAQYNILKMYNDKNLPKHELMRARYRERPYLKDTKDIELAERFNDISLNLSTLTHEGKIGVVMSSSNIDFWTEKITHVFEEYSRRGGIPPELLKENGIPKPTYPVVPNGSKILKGKPFPTPPHAIKFGEKKHIEEMYNRGKIRISPASLYKDPSLNHAINDNELKRLCIGQKDGTTLRVLNQDTGEPGEEIELIGDFEISTNSTTNYYAFCTCAKYDYRLIDDFGYDAMVIISDGDEFRDRLYKAMKSKLGEEYMEADDIVKYYDPYNANPDKISLFFSKNFKYAYQSEYRFIWVPEKDIMELEPIYIEIGSIADIAEYYSLD